MGLMSFLKGLFGSRDPIDLDDDLPALPPAPVPAPAPIAAPAPMPVTPPAPPAPPQFRLATRYPTTIDFPAVLRRAGVDIDEQQRVTKAQDLLRSLPDDSPAALKRQIVEAAFKAFDVPTQKIISAATSEVEALEAFIQEGGAKVQQVLDEGTARIAELDAEIAEIRESMAAAVSDQAIRDAATQQQIAGVRPIIAFFAQSQPGLNEFLKGPEPAAPRPGRPAEASRSEPIPRPGEAARSEPIPRPDFLNKGPETPRPDFLKPRTNNPLPDFMTDDIDVE